MTNDHLGAWMKRMPDAQYFDAQAELCLQIANQMSDPTAAEKLRADAAHYHKRARSVEASGVTTKALAEQSRANGLV